jgi:hypothetical protein
MRPRAFSLALAALALSAPALANEMVLENGRDIVINKLVLAASGSDNWLNVLKAGETIDPGWNFSVEFEPASDGCVFDFQASFADGSVRAVNGYDACSLDDLDMNVLRFKD